MSLREPQRDALQVLHDISATIDYKTAPLDSVAAIATEKSKAAKPVTFDTQFPSFCFALATGVGKTRLMGACIYYLRKTIEVPLLCGGNEDVSLLLTFLGNTFHRLSQFAIFLCSFVQPNHRDSNC